MQQARKLKTDIARPESPGKRLFERARKYSRWRQMGETWRRITRENHRPRVVAVGPRIKGGLRSLYTSKLGYGTNPGEVYEVTCRLKSRVVRGKGKIGRRREGCMDAAAIASVYHAVMNLGVKTVEVWVDGVDMERAARAIRNVVGERAEVIMSPLGTLDADKFWDGAYLNWDTPRSEIPKAPKPRNFERLSGADAVVFTEPDARVFPHEIWGENIIHVSNRGLELSPTAIGVMTEGVEKGAPAIVVMGTPAEGEAGGVAGTGGSGERRVESLVKLVRGEAKAGEVSLGLKRLQKMVMENGVEVIGACFDIAEGVVRGVE